MQENLTKKFQYSANDDDDDIPQPSNQILVGEGVLIN